MGIFVYLAINFLFLSHPAACLSADTRQGDAYVTAVLSDIVTLNPILASDSVSHQATSMIFNGLTKYDENYGIIGDLAEDWKISDDNLKITFRLRNNVYWHDGAPLTADDVKFTFDAIRDPATGCPYRSSFDYIERVEVMDAHQVAFYLKFPYAPFLSKAGMSILPRHLFANQPVRGSEYNRRPIGSGPYKFGQWKYEQYLLLDANPDYFLHRPHIDKYVFRIIPDESIQFLELISGGVDAVGLSPYQYKKRSNTARFNERFSKYVQLARTYTYLGYNLRDPVVGDAHVRRALSYAVDKSAIIDGVLLGLGEECTGPFFKNSPYYNHKADAYDYNPALARRILDDAGWLEDENGRRKKDGVLLRTVILTNQGNQQRYDAAAIIQQYWQDIGVDCSIRVIAWSSLIENFIKNRTFQVILLGWTIPVEPDPFSVWHSQAAASGGLNFIGYENQEVDRLIEKGRMTFDEDERINIYKQMHQIIAREAPYTFLYFPYQCIAVSKRYKGVRNSPAGIGFNFIDWYVDAGERKY